MHTDQPTIHATLTNWDLYMGHLSGNIYNDVASHGNHPFPNGMRVSTSQLKRIYNLPNGTKVAETVNSNYILA